MRHFEGWIKYAVGGNDLGADLQSGKDLLSWRR